MIITTQIKVAEAIIKEKKCDFILLGAIFYDLDNNLITGDSIVETLVNPSGIPYARVCATTTAIEERFQGQFVLPPSKFKEIVNSLFSYFTKQGLPRLLVVHRDTLNIMTITTLLNGHCETEGATTLTEAKNALQQQKFDLMIVGNKFNSQHGIGDDMLPELLKIQNVPFGRIGFNDHECKQVGRFVISTIAQLGAIEFRRQILEQLASVLLESK